MYRDYGQRVSDRQKTRLMWLVEEMGAQKFRETVSKYIGYDLKPGKHITVSSHPSRITGPLPLAPPSIPAPLPVPTFQTPVLVSAAERGFLASLALLREARA